jgi:hypothetical protein
MSIQFCYSLWSVIILQDCNLDNIWNLTLSPVVDEIIAQTVREELAPISQELQALKTSSPVLPISPRLKLGFAQAESKDFNVSKFIKETDRIKLAGDLLVNLEHFWDSILRIFPSLSLLP